MKSTIGFLFLSLALGACSSEPASDSLELEVNADEIDRAAEEAAAEIDEEGAEAALEALEEEVGLGD